MSYRIGYGYAGTDSVKTSGQNENILESVSDGVFEKSRYYYKLSFYNETSCQIKINNGEPIFLRSGQGFEMNESDAPIIKFEIVESGINYNFVAAY